MAEYAWLDSLQQWLIANPGWAALVIFLVAFTESVVVVGILIPGIMILFVLGALIGLGLLDFYFAWIAASAGAVLGDGFSYWIGRRYRDSLESRWPFRRWPELLTQGRDLFRRRGVMGVVIGRFVGPLRPIVPVVAGMLGMRPRVFYPTALIAGIAWSPAYLLPGVVLGASLDVASAYTLRLGVLLGIFALISWLIAISIREIYLSLTRRTPWLLKRTATSLRRHPLIAHYFGPLVIPARGDVLSIVMLGVVLIGAFTLVSIALLYLIIPGTPDIDQLLLSSASALRNHIADLPLLVGLLISDWRALSISALALLGWLLWQRRLLAAGHWLAAVAGAPLLAVILQAMVRWLPGWPDYLYEWGRFPDLASVYCCITLGFFPVLMARDLRAHQRKWYYLAAALLMLLALFSRVYFHLASFSGVISALLLATIWAAVVGIGFRVRASAWHPPHVPIRLFYSLFASALILLISIEGARLQQQLKPQLEDSSLTTSNWLEQGWRSLPRYRGWSGATHEQFNLQWLGSMADIRQDLADDGWQWHPDSFEFVRLLTIIHPNPPAEDLPLMRKDYRGHAASAMFSQPLNEQQIAVLRLWDSGRVDEQQRTLWLGEINVEHRQVRGWWFTLWSPLHDAQATATAWRQLFDSLNDWQRQQVEEQYWLLWPDAAKPQDPNLIKP
ncbi:MAG: bifunctional DedA family/phosphatase PAP2 family protein [Wenzhouxiangellaceae bacterium]